MWKFPHIGCKKSGGNKFPNKWTKTSLFLFLSRSALNFIKYFTQRSRFTKAFKCLVARNLNHHSCVILKEKWCRKLFNFTQSNARRMFVQCSNDTLKYVRTLTSDKSFTINRLLDFNSFLLLLYFSIFIATRLLDGKGNRIGMKWIYWKMNNSSDAWILRGWARTSF